MKKIVCKFKHKNICQFLTDKYKKPFKIKKDLCLICAYKERKK
jgi:hypothetical protein